MSIENEKFEQAFNELLLLAKGAQTAREPRQIMADAALQMSLMNVRAITAEKKLGDLEERTNEAITVLTDYHWREGT